MVLVFLLVLLYPMKPKVNADTCPFILRLPHYINVGITDPQSNMSLSFTRYYSSLTDPIRAHSKPNHIYSKQLHSSFSHSSEHDINPRLSSHSSSSNLDNSTLWYDQDCSYARPDIPREGISCECISSLSLYLVRTYNMVASQTSKIIDPNNIRNEYVNHSFIKMHSFVFLTRYFSWLNWFASHESSTRSKIFHTSQQAPHYSHPLRYRRATFHTVTPNVMALIDLITTVIH